MTVEYLPTLPPPPPANAEHVPHQLRVRRPVMAEAETALAATVGHLQFRCMRRVTAHIDRDWSSGDPDPDGIAYDDIGGSETGIVIDFGQRGPFATHIVLVIHYRVDEGASSAPRLDITLEQDDALDGTDVDAPAAETSAGIRLEGDSLPGDEDGAEIRPVTLLLDDMQDTPAAYPTGPRALDYHGLATDTDVQVRIVPRSVDLIAVQCVELVRL